MAGPFERCNEPSDSVNTAILLASEGRLLRIQDDSKLLSGFPWPIGMEVKAVMNNPPNSRLW
jgi:hypothetical protein